MNKVRMSYFMAVSVCRLCSGPGAFGTGREKVGGRGGSMELDLQCPSIRPDFTHLRLFVLYTLTFTHTFVTVLPCRP